MMDGNNYGAPKKLKLLLCAYKPVVNLIHLSKCNISHCLKDLDINCGEGKK